MVYVIKCMSHPLTKCGIGVDETFDKAISRLDGRRGRWFGPWDGSVEGQLFYAGGTGERVDVLHC